MTEKNNQKSGPDSSTDGQKPATPAQNETVELRIEKLVTGGQGLGKVDGQAVFVPMTAVGDLVEAKIIRKRKGFIQAAVETLIEPGPGRQEAPCQYYGQCGGCDFQHLDAPTQRQAKTDIILDCFTRLGKMDVGEILSGPEAPAKEMGYRNRIRLYSNNIGHYGMMRKGTNDVVALDGCPIMPDAFNENVIPWVRFLPPVEQVVVRMDEEDRWLVSVYGPPARMKVMKKMLKGLEGDAAPAEGCVGVIYNNLPLWGRDYLIHTVSGHKFKVSAQSFFQGNKLVTEDAVATIREWLDELKQAGSLGGLLGDLFCGAGLFSLALADMFEKVVAIDSDDYAMRDAANNVARSEVARDKVSLHKGELGWIFAKGLLAEEQEWAESCCLVDPPRTGLGKDGVKALLKLKPKTILYMSCDPATLARDVAVLKDSGYVLKKLKALEMFPQTAHIETLGLLELA
jgi:23S rRNA (uracil1939-C5)-methyltransferase